MYIMYYFLVYMYICEKTFYFFSAIVTKIIAFSMLEANIE